MGRMQTKAADYEHKVYDKKLAEHFIHELDEKDMISEFVKEMSALEDTDDTSKWVLSWTQWVEAQKLQEEALDNIKRLSTLT